MRHMKHISRMYAPHISPNSAYFHAYFASKSSAYFKKILRYKPASLVYGSKRVFLHKVSPFVGLGDKK